MNSDNALLDQADALMRRHRVFVAGAQAEAAVVADTHPAAKPAGDTDLDDLPLLTEVVGAAPLAAEDQASGPDASLSQRLEEERRAALVLELENWLDEQLPQLVIRAMDGITDQAVALITNRAREELLPRLCAIIRGDSDRSE
jgi:hypothetical protein